jgi:hypothetical protein
MPVVQRYGERKVSTDALRGGQKTAAETPLSEGAGLAEAQGQQAETVGRIAGGMGQFATQQIQKVRDQEDDLVTLAAQNALGKASVDIATRAQEVKGRDTLTLPDTTTHDFNTVADDIAAGLSNDRQREAFAKVRARHDLNLYETVGRHISNEMQNYRSSELKSAIDLGINQVAANALDPRRGKEELDTMIAAVQQQGPAMGWGSAQVADQIANIRSASHIAVVQRLVDNNQPTNAKIYYEETQHEINGEKRGDLEKLLAHATQRADGQREADAIIAASGTLAEQRAKAKEIQDPNTRAAAMTLVEHEAAVNEKAARDGEEHLLDAVYTRLMGNGGDLRSLTPTEQLQLGKHLPALRSFALSLAKGEPPDTDPAVYYALKTMSTDPDMRGAFLKENLLAHRNNLSHGDFEKLVDLQASMRKGDQEKADKINAPFLTHKELVETSLTQYGIPTKDTPAHKLTPEEKATTAQLYRMLDQKTTELQAGGKKVSNQDLQSEIDRALMRHVTVTQSRFFGLTTGDVDKRLLGLTIADVTPVEKAALAAALKLRNQPVTDVTMMDLYIANRMRTGR